MPKIQAFLDVMSYRLANSNYLPVDLNQWTELNKFYRQMVGTTNMESVMLGFYFQFCNEKLHVSWEKRRREDESNLSS